MCGFLFTQRKRFDSCVQTLQIDELVGGGGGWGGGGLSTSQAALLYRDHCGLDSGPQPFRFIS